MHFLKPSQVVFANPKIEKEFNKLRENDEIKNMLEGLLKT